MSQNVYILLLLMVSLVLLAPNRVNAAEVYGECGNCHTIHNSQNNLSVTYQVNATYDGYDTSIDDPERPPLNYLLITDCAGCHSAADNATINVGDDEIPIVFNIVSPTSPLAGGNFYYVGLDDTNGHNVYGYSDQDVTLGLTPPGGSVMSTQLTCAGEFGCHGDRTAGNTNDLSMKGAHHSDDVTGGITGASSGLSYRYLNGILGTEDNDWEQETAVDHNQYKGSTSSATDTISYLCSRCHGNFHTWVGGASEVGTASPWLRHPTDVVLPNSSEYASYTSYNALAPVAQTTPSTDTTYDTVSPGSDVVMCLSCHRAHGSPNYKMLRWDIKDTLANAISGCNVCHTSKN